MNKIRKSIDAGTHYQSDLEWSDKHFQAAVINVLKQLITNYLETNEKLKKKISKETETIKNNQLETIKLKNTIMDY